MQPTISIDNGELGSHNWSLVLSDPMQVFWLGQDVKFVQRVLGMDCSYLCSLVHERMGDAVGQLNMDDPKVREAIAVTIIDQVGGTQNVRKLESWDLSSQ